MSFMQMIRVQFGIDAQGRLKQFSKSTRKFASFTARKKFLRRCKRERIFPNHLQSKVDVFNYLRTDNDKINTKINNLKNIIVNKVIKIELLCTYHELKKVSQQRTLLKASIEQSLPRNISQSFFAMQQESFEINLRHINQHLIEKFDSIKSRIINTMIPGHQDWFVNKTQTNIPERVSLFLSLGPKFGLPTPSTNMPVVDLIADTENILQMGNNDNIKDVVRSKISNAIQNHRKFCVPSTVQRIILKYKKETLLFLKNHKDIAIVPADKGNITVAIMKEDLENKTLTLLNDKTTYMTCNDPTATLLNSVKQLMKDLVTRKFIEQKSSEKLYTNSPSAPKLYVLPKIHKDGTPVRPIVSWSNSPCYLLSKYLAKILLRSHIGTYNVTNSYEFQKVVTTVQLEENENLVSYDVQSLFTNVPIYLVLCLINETWQNIEQHTKIEKKWFLKCMRLCCIQSNYFVYHNTFYRQTFGCPMGSPLAPIMADMLMTKLLNCVIPRLTFIPKFVYKYVDDLVTIIPSDKIDETLELFNSFHERINFTYEVEQNRTLEYLDLQLLRNDINRIETKPYIKPTSKLRVLHYESFHPNIHKRNIINNTINRLFTLTSSSHMSDTENLVYKILRKNGYPSQAICSSISKFKSKRNINDNNRAVDSNQNIVNSENADNMELLPAYVSISYVNDLSEKIAYIIKKHSGDSINIKIAFKINNTIKNNCFTKMKDITEKRKMSNVVYKISCECGQQYVGQTSNYVINRMYGHHSDIKSALQRSGNQSPDATTNNGNNLLAVPYYNRTLSPTPPSILQRSRDKSAVYYHVLDSNHNIDVYDMDNIQILCKESNLFKRLIKEMLYIQTTTNTMNKKSEIDCLSRIYRAIL